MDAGPRARGGRGASHSAGSRRDRSPLPLVP